MNEPDESAAELLALVTRGGPTSWSTSRWPARRRGAAQLGRCARAWPRSLRRVTRHAVQGIGARIERSLLARATPPRKAWVVLDMQNEPPAARRAPRGPSRAGNRARAGREPRGRASPLSSGLLRRRRARARGLQSGRLGSPQHPGHFGRGGIWPPLAPRTRGRGWCRKPRPSAPSRARPSPACSRSSTWTRSLPRGVSRRSGSSPPRPTPCGEATSWRCRRRRKPAPRRRTRRSPSASVACFRPYGPAEPCSLLSRLGESSAGLTPAGRPTPAFNLPRCPVFHPLRAFRDNRPRMAPAAWPGRARGPRPLCDGSRCPRLRSGPQFSARSLGPSPTGGRRGGLPGRQSARSPPRASSPTTPRGAAAPPPVGPARTRATCVAGPRALARGGGRRGERRLQSHQHAPRGQPCPGRSRPARGPPRLARTARGGA